jgi:hypothetical protein
MSTNEHAPGPWFFPILLSVGLAFFGLAIGIGQLRATPKR